MLRTSLSSIARSLRVEYGDQASNPSLVQCTRSCTRAHHCVRKCCVARLKAKAREDITEKGTRWNASAMRHGRTRQTTHACLVHRAMDGTMHTPNSQRNRSAQAWITQGFVDALRCAWCDTQRKRRLTAHTIIVVDQRGSNFPPFSSWRPRSRCVQDRSSLPGHRRGQCHRCQ